MELKDFIVATIEDISAAVSEADNKIRHYGGLVNPGDYPGNFASGGMNPGGFIPARTTLNFDIAVSASKEGKAGGGAKAKIWVVEASFAGEGTTRSETVSRLTFSIDVVLPHDRNQFARI